MTDLTQNLIDLKLNRLRGLRVEMELSQEQMAKLVGISNSSYQRKESGESPFLLTEAYKLSKILGKTIDEIFFYTI